MGPEILITETLCIKLCNKLPQMGEHILTFICSMDPNATTGHQSVVLECITFTDELQLFAQGAEWNPTASATLC